MLVTVKELLAEAEEQQRAVGAFNVPNLEAVRGVIQAAEMLKVPVILQHAEVHESLISIEEIGPVMVHFAKEASVPVAVHLDHGSSLAECIKAIRLGFTSIMYDASLKDYETNVKESSKLVRIAHSVNVSVEAELGEMTNSTVGSGEGRASEEGAIGNQDLFTNPQQAQDFVEATDVDSLAISFGTVHGKYFAEPNLDFDRIAAIRATTGNRPLVMHGGSGVSEEDYKQAIAAGIRKINYYTYMNLAAGQALQRAIEEQPKEELFFDEFSLAATAAIKENVAKALRIFNRL
ncbi:MAG: class II fructose-bisphosphate aldolase [Enterococcus sp.]|uniref:class II fructose-bisphosphate aldolase n=1 Tax=Enterococcus sp. TaxID=35783 RepID=UPI0026499C85|nr:class II fructose-bisphosphate aldolase [Enterococcus sp.]MDN6002336.1 class II fructose-bisphosphate aldolase [Enterococcus sp.]MDN6217049.1 class II fructose-bisphosphate aldolase [Enterococcus sp.]MDN6516705.1 class II fructose-bisphosphate aldolase [Enterococcus sp.]MDN6560043.1 class II fructose-bisphosphate aldolase [Enterococcus sp.]MDN6583763.1 class II fructose-bisphosphate aldolase [Enterococcus sp.]